MSLNLRFPIQSLGLMIGVHKRNFLLGRCTPQKWADGFLQANERYFVGFRANVLCARVGGGGGMIDISTILTVHEVVGYYTVNKHVNGYK